MIVVQITIHLAFLVLTLKNQEGKCKQPIAFIPKVVPFLLFFAGIYHASLAVKPLINSQLYVVLHCFKPTLIHSRTTNKKLCLKQNSQSAITPTSHVSVFDINHIDWKLAQCCIMWNRWMDESLTSLLHKGVLNQGSHMFTKTKFHDFPLIYPWQILWIPD